MNKYFEIKNLKCSYNSKEIEPKVVLEIEELNIPQGVIVFIVGQSGCGKSTILETLGLMNNTILSADKFLIKPENGVEIEGIDVWKNRNKVLSDIRMKYFSFIFQQTNLMKYFSIWENAIIPQMIKGGNKKYKDVIVETGLEQILNEGKNNIGELSGGQQQRLAFVRAFLPHFKIIFGDEPTGNLDPKNADNLMEIVKNEIYNSDDNKTAIFVSHSPELSLKFADIIIKIQIKDRNNNETYGLIDQNSVFEKQDGKWFHNNRGIAYEELEKIIKG
jgi:ABC-type lipoprotein export system ATPase subunit